MKITILESKRIISRITLLGFFAFVFIVSVYESHKNLYKYSLTDTWKNTLAEARAFKGLYLDRECMERLREDINSYGYLNGDNITELISVNYERKMLEELSGEEMEGFFRIRAERIYENLAGDTQKGYTDEEIAGFMDKARSMSALSMEYAEGWKVLAEKMGSFVLMIVTVISVLLLPLFGRDPSVKMEELVRSGRYGKRQLDMARIKAAYLTATVLYLCSMTIYFVIIMLPFGFDGANQPIQSNVRTFFSLYNITFLQQFLLNLFIGYAVMIFVVSLVLPVTILLKNILAGASVIAIFLVMLVIFNQVYLYQVNHWFTNFMPVRMTDFWHFYTGNELYRIFGLSISCMNWSIAVALFLSVIFLTIALIMLYINGKKGLSG